MTNNSLTSLSARQLRRAATLKDKIEKLQEELSKVLGSNPATAKSAAPAKRKRKMSAAGRGRISAAAKARWAKLKAAAKK